MVSEPPRPMVVMSLDSGLMPWNPATMATRPASRASCTRWGLTLTIRARPYEVSVSMPAWEPV